MLSPARLEKLEKEIKFSALRSSGPGGQNVNKVNTKVEIRFHVDQSRILTDFEKNVILKKLKNKINAEGELIIISQSGRTQNSNKEAALKKFRDSLNKSLAPVKKRIATKPSKASVEKRLEEKKILSEKKARRNY